MPSLKSAAYKISAARVGSRQGKPAIPKSLCFIGASWPTVSTLRDRFPQGIPFWGNPYWLDRVDYPNADILTIVSWRLLQALRTAGAFECEEIPICIYGHNRWKTARLTAPWSEPPPKRKATLITSDFVGIAPAWLDVIAWSRTPYRNTTAEERRRDPPVILSPDFDIICPAEGLPPLFELEGPAGIFVSAEGRRAAERDGCVVEYSEPIRVLPPRSK